jgi:ribosomal protein S14
MFILIGIVVLVVLLVFFGRRRPRSEPARRARSRLIETKGTIRADTYCEVCGRPSALCRRDQKKATHAEGMVGKKK